MNNVDAFTFNDKKEVYTNGADLIPVFRVEQIIEAMKLQELVDKATPKKPTNRKYDNVNDIGSGICICNSRVYEYHMFCPDCGQAIDWSEDD